MRASKRPYRAIGCATPMHRMPWITVRRSISFKPHLGIPQLPLQAGISTPGPPSRVRAISKTCSGRAIDLLLGFDLESSVTTNRPSHITMKTLKLRVFPRCGQPYNEPPAVSREDPSIEVCLACGTSRSLGVLCPYHWQDWLRLAAAEIPRLGQPTILDSKARQTSPVAARPVRRHRPRSGLKIASIRPSYPASPRLGRCAPHVRPMRPACRLRWPGWATGVPAHRRPQTASRGYFTLVGGVGVQAVASP